MSWRLWPSKSRPVRNWRSITPEERGKMCGLAGFGDYYKTKFDPKLLAYVRRVNRYATERAAARYEAAKRRTIAMRQR